MRAQQMKMFSLVAVVAMFGLAAFGATSASAKRVWTFKGAELAPGKEEAITVVKTNVHPILISEVSKQEVVVECSTIKLAHRHEGKLETNGFIYNEAKSTSNVGRDRGVVVFETCSVKGLASLVCKLTPASAKEIQTPPVSEGRTTLVEEPAGSKNVWDDFLAEGKKAGETERVFARIGLEGGSCPTKEDIVKSTVISPEFNEAKEGEGGVAALIEVQGEAAKHKFIFPCVAHSEAINWLGNKITIGTFKDFTPGEEGPATFCGTGKVPLEVEAELVNKENWGVK